nr:cation:proton antiporter [Synechococcus sp. PCC 7336]
MASDVASAEAISAPDGTLMLVSVLLSLVVIYLASKVMGELCARFNLPAVLGELLGGVLVGGSILHLLVFPEGAIAPGELAELAQSSRVMQLLQSTGGVSAEALGPLFVSQSEVIEFLSELGVIILLFEIGLESDLTELLKVGPQAAAVAVVGVTVPFAIGTLGLLYFFHIPTVAAIFAGAALTATSIGITARVLAELQQLSSGEGQIIIGAAVLDDILGIVILAVVAGLAKTGEVDLANVGIIIVSAVLFLVGAIILGRFLSPYLVSMLDGMQTRGTFLIPGLIVAFVLGYIGQILQLEAILGAFAAGLILAETDKHHEFEEQIKPISDFLTPIFFVVVGAKTNLAVLNPFDPNNGEGLIVASFLVAVAILGKIAAGLGAFGGKKVNRYAIGVGMIPRGEVGLVFAGVGAASGALPPALDSAIIVMVIVTTFVAPLWLRSAFKGGAAEPAVLAEGEAPSLDELKASVVAQDAAAQELEPVEAIAAEAENPGT